MGMKVVQSSVPPKVCSNLQKPCLNAGEILPKHFISLPSCCQKMHNIQPKLIYYKQISKKSHLHTEFITNSY